MKNKKISIKNDLAAFVVVAFLVLASVLTATMVPAEIAEAQFNQPSTTTTPLEEEEGEEQEVPQASAGGLTVTLNGDSFGRGDTITIRGTVEEREPDSYVSIEVIDPQSNTVESAFPDVTADNTFTHSFIAGEQEEFDPNEPMEISGNYRVVATYFPPGDDFETEQVELVFAYDASTATAGGTEVGGEGGGPTTTFQSITDGFRVQVPNGWVVQDINSTESWVQQNIAQYGVEQLAYMCPQNQALPAVGGLYSCPSDTQTQVVFSRFVDLQSRPEIAALARENRSITTSDLLALYLDYYRSFSDPQFFEGFEIVNDTDIALNVVDPQTNQTTGTVPGKYVEWLHTDAFGGIREFVLLALSSDANTGYFLDPIISEGLDEDAEAPPFVRQVLGSFELLTTTPSAVTTNTTAGTTTPSPATVQPQQLEQSAGGLTARLNANNFTTGDTITVNGTVADRAGSSYVTIFVVDPRGEYVESDQPRVTADNTFTHNFVAGEPDEIIPEYQMVVSGNYLLQVIHGTTMVELTFAYEATGNMTTGETPAAPPSPAQEEPQQQQQQQQPSPLSSQQLQSPQQQEGQQQQSQSGGTGVSIVPGSSSLTTDAYQPNPIQVSVGDTVTWTNDDTQPHTVTSGENVNPDGRFDSGIMAPAATFDFTFTEAGEYPYFCLLHPNMVGTVTVTAAGSGS
jgi:plastocyanin